MIPDPDYEPAPEEVLDALVVSVQVLYSILLKKGVITAEDMAIPIEEVSDVFDIEVERSRMYVERKEEEGDEDDE